MTIPYDLAQHLRDMGLIDPKQSPVLRPTEKPWMPSYKGEEPPF